jgi:hypothetical protein
MRVTLASALDAASVGVVGTRVRPLMVVSSGEGPEGHFQRLRRPGER